MKKFAEENVFPRRAQGGLLIDNNTTDKVLAFGL